LTGAIASAFDELVALAEGAEALALERETEVIAVAATTASKAPVKKKPSAKKMPVKAVKKVTSKTVRASSQKTRKTA
jgi:hypothetical protein